MRKYCGSDATVISKIESPSGVINVEEILEVADEVLIDRGDLSRRVPLEKVPFLQRRIISIAKSKKNQSMLLLICLNPWLCNVHRQEQNLMTWLVPC